MPTSSVARHLILAVSLSLALTACSLFPSATATPTPISLPSDIGTATPIGGYPGPTIAANQPTATGGATTTTPAGGYPAPTTGTVQPTVAPGGPTATVAPGGPTATVAPGGPTAVPSTGGGLVGPEWTIAYSGDLNADGKPDVVAYKPGGVAPNSTFQQPAYSAYKGSAAEIVIVQADASGKPQVQASITRQTVSAGGATLYSYPSATIPAALMVASTPGAATLVSVLPINTTGAPYTQAIGLVWDKNALVYRLFSPYSK